ncbi:L-selectin-like [Acanthochromis polyacanthus]|uniref:L-selectin-like n=1 Tax=Acanthochromis polyacanthus TaxID=80966 RepID=UPI0022343609|nr:L-selectin-like [Acanthochromis polyacanthus]
MNMEFGLFQTRGCKSSTSWICLTFLCSMLCMWTNVECWSYYFSNTTMNWRNARAWCKEHYTDMVAIQNQEEIEHLNSWLPKKSSYYWIGIRKINDVWTWVGTNKSLTAEATNWAMGEPNNGKTAPSLVRLSEDCVEMYIKRDQQAGKWNDERCSKLKSALCYKAACQSDSCLHGDCVETINSHKCDCFEGFYGDKCEHAIACNPLADPAHASQLCFHPFGSNRFNSSCLFSCELGFRLVGESQLFCQASGHWSQPLPLCQVEQCPDLSHTKFSGGTMICRHPVGPHSYNSTCEFRCYEGFDLIGENLTRCDHSGQWTASVPACTIQCFYRKL